MAARTGGVASTPGWWPGIAAVAAVAAAAVALANLKSWPFMYHVRLLVAMTRGGLTPTRIREDDATVERFWAGPDDLDSNMHMSNSSYNKNADIARVVYFARLVAEGNLYRTYKLNNGGVAMFFHREIKPLSAYEIHTRVAGWNAKWIVLVQVFYVRGQRVALGGSKIVVKLPSGKTVPPEDFFRALGWDLDRLRDVCAEWKEVVETMLAYEAALAGAADRLVPASRL